MRALSTAGTPIDVTDLTLAGDFTLESWVLLPTTGGTTDDGAVLSGNGPDLRVETGLVTLSDGTSQVVAASTAIATDTWTHVAVTREAGVVSIFLDGVLDATSAVTWTGDFLVSTLADGLIASFDEFRIWSDARTQTEIQDNLGAPVDPASADLARYYSFEGDGTDLVDETGVAANDALPIDASFVTSDAPITQPPSAFISDDFNTTTLESFWNATPIVPRPGTDVQLKVDGDEKTVLLVAPAGQNTDPFNTFDGVRLVQPVADEDFQLVAKFLSSPTPGVAFQEQGFAVFQDDQNWLRFDVYSSASTGALNSVGAVTVNGATTVVYNDTAVPTANAAFVRLTRDGDDWTFETSPDGEVWFQAGSTVPAALNVTEAGVFAGSDGDGFTAEVDYVFNTAAPILLEDGVANTPPDAVDDIATVGEDTAASIDVLANDTDVENDPLTITAVLDGANGAAVIDTNGTADPSDDRVIYTPNADFVGADSVSYTISDGINEDTASISITVEEATSGALFSDDFSDGSLDPRWDYLGIAGSASLTSDADDAYLQIISPAGVPVSASDALTTPRVLQPSPDGDFQAVVRFLNEPAQTFQEHGLLIVEDDQNFIRLDVAYTSNDVLRVIVGDTRDGDTDFLLQRSINSGEAQYLRATRTGDDYVLEYSADGQTWTNAQTFTSDIAVSSVGVFAGSAPSDGSTPGLVPGFTSEVDFFEVASDPIISEDDDSTFVSDDFNTNALEDFWTFDAPSGGTVTQVADPGEAFVVLSAPAGVDTNPVGDLDAVSLLQEVEDTDFQIEAKFLTRPTPGTAFQQQGFLILQDDLNWVRLDVFSDDETGALRAFGSVTTNGVTPVSGPNTFNVELPAIGHANFLRVTRSGDDFVLETRPDEDSDWFEDGRLTADLTVTQAGVFSGSAGQGGDPAPGYDARVDYVFNSVSPISPEDGDPVDNFAPTAVDDEIITAPENAAAIDVLANDLDPESDPLQLVSFTQGGKGVVSLDDNGTPDDRTDDQLIYTPTGTPSGTDSFTYTISDGEILDTGTVNVIFGTEFISDDFNTSDIQPFWTESPIGASRGGTVTIGQDGDERFVTLTAPPDVDTDPFDDAFDGVGLLQPTANTDFLFEAKFLDLPDVDLRFQGHGLVALADENNYIRLDIFSRGNNDDDLYAFGGVTINGETTTKFGNGAPGTPLVKLPSVQHATFLRMVREGDTWSLQTSAVGGDDENWTTSGSFTLTPTEAAILEIDQIGVFAASVGPGSGETGAPGYSTRVDYVFEDGSRIVPEDGVGDGNSGPTAFNDAVVALAEEATRIEVLDNDLDPENDDIRIVSVNTENTQGSVVINGQSTQTGADDAVTYTSAPGFTGTETFTYTITDGEFESTATVTVTVGGAFASDDFNTGELQPFWRSLDIDGATVEIGAAGGDAFVTLAAAPEADTDPINDLNSVSLLQPVANEDFQLEASFLEIPDPDLRFQGHGFLALQDEFNWVRLDIFSRGELGNDRLFAFGGVTIGGVTTEAFNLVQLPTPEYAHFLRLTRAGDIFTLEASDGVDSNNDGEFDNWVELGQVEADLDLTEAGVFAGSVGPTAGEEGAPGYTTRVDYVFNTADPILIEDDGVPDNFAPIANDDIESALANVQRSIDVTANDVDPEGGEILITAVTTPNNATAIIDIDTNQILFTPDLGYVGPSTFTYTITDGEFSDTATVTVDVGAGLPSVFVLEDGVDGFDGTFTGSNASAQIQPSNPLSTLTEGAIEFVVTFDSDTGREGLVSADATNFGEGGHLSLVKDGDGLLFRLQNGSNQFGDSFSIEVDNVLEANELTHILASFGPDGMKLYVNGVQVGANAYTGSTFGSVEQLVIGANNWASESGETNKIRDALDGEVERVAIYQEQPDDASVDALAIAALSPDQTQVFPDAATTDEDTPITIDVLANEVGFNSEPLTLVSVGDPDNGTAEIVNGEILYTPNENFSGTDSFTYTATTPSTGPGAATVTVTVAAVNDDPIANDDTAVVNIGETVAISVLQNDTDADPDAVLTVTDATDGALGTVVVNPDNTITYTQVSGVGGQTDTFTYTVTDGVGAPQIATVTVTLQDPDNSAPNAVADVANVLEDASVTFQPGDNDTDADGDDVIAAAIATDPSNGAAVVNPDGTVTYTPNADFEGVDSFEITVTDGKGGFATADAAITVTGVEDDPVANDDAASVEIGDVVVISVLDNDTDGDADDTLTVTAVTTPTAGAVQIIGGGTALLYTPDPSATPGDSVTFDYTLSDGDGPTDTATVTVAVEASSFPTPIFDEPDPVEFTGSTASVVETPAAEAPSAPVAGTISGVINPDDLNGQQGIFSSDASGFGLHQSIYLNGDDLIARLQNDQNQEVFLTYSGVAVGVALPFAVTFGAGQVGLWINGVLEDSASLNTSLQGQAQQWGGRGWRSEQGESGDIDAAFNGEISKRQIYDVALTQDQIEELHEVAPDTLDPIAVPDLIDIDEDSGPFTFDPAANDSDPDDGVPVATAVSAANNGATVLNADNTVTYTPNANFFGTDTFTVTIEDGQGGSATSITTVTVDAIEDDPVANDDTVSTQVNEDLVINVLANDQDLDLQGVDVVEVSVVDEGGTAVLNPNNTVTFMPDADFVGTATFTYTLEDAGGQTDTATVTVDVLAEATLPTPVFEEELLIFNGNTDNIYFLDPSEAPNIDEGTIAFAFEYEDTGLRQGLVSRDASGLVGDGNHFTAWVDDDELFIRFQDGVDTAIFSTEAVDEQVYEVAATFSDAGVEAFVDGVSIGSDANVTMSFANSPEWLQAGAAGWASASGDDKFSIPLVGEIANLEFYDEVLDQDQITLLAEQNSFEV